MRILDLTPGNRGIWFDKDHPDATFAYGLPIKETGFGLIVFDPPHANFGANGNMAKNYGNHAAHEIRLFIAAGAEEAYRVSVAGALMAFKWNDHDQKLPRVLALMTRWWEPLFGQKTATRSPRLNSTYWVLLRRRKAPLSTGVAAEAIATLPGYRAFCSEHPEFPPVTPDVFLKQRIFDVITKNFLEGCRTLGPVQQ